MEGIFVGGMIKSGTSLVRRLAESHPDIFSGLETYWFDLYNNFESQNLKKGALLAGQISITDEARLKNISLFYNLDYEIVLCIYQSCDDALSFLSQVFEKCLKRNQNPESLWLEKTPGNALYAEQIIHAGYKYIHVIRDPLDVWYSCKRDKKFLSINEFIDVYENYQQPLVNNTSANMALVVYENLIADYKNVMSNFFNYVGKNNFLINKNSGVDSGRELTLVRKATGKVSATLKRLESPIDSDSIGVGNDLPMKEVKMIKKELADFFYPEICKNFRKIIL